MVDRNQPGSFCHMILIQRVVLSLLTNGIQCMVHNNSWHILYMVEVRMVYNVTRKQEEGHHNLTCHISKQNGPLCHILYMGCIVHSGTCYRVVYFFLLHVTRRMIINVTYGQHSSFFYILRVSMVNFVTCYAVQHDHFGFMLRGSLNYSVIYHGVTWNILLHIARYNEPFVTYHGVAWTIMLHITGQHGPFCFILRVSMVYSNTCYRVAWSILPRQKVHSITCYGIAWSILLHVTGQNGL